MSVEGEGAIYGVPLTSAHATFTTAGTFHETGTLGFDEFGLSIGGRIDATTDLAAGTTSGTIAGGFSFLGQGVEQEPPLQRHRLRLLQGRRGRPPAPRSASCSSGAAASKSSTGAAQKRSPAPASPPRTTRDLTLQIESQALRLHG